MARMILTVGLIALLNVLAGCHGVDSGKSQLLTTHMQAVTTVDAGETDLIEQMAINRSAYRKYLESLVAHYEKTGNRMKLGWAKSELEILNKIPQYNYIVEAIFPGPRLKATNSIALADYMYADAVRLEKRAGQLLVLKNEDMLRESLDQYNQLIKKHPSSDKIDDAAFRAAGICEHFKDYTIALLYYQRTFQWNPKTPYPAEYKAAYLLDRRFSRRAEALELYLRAVEKEGLSSGYREVAQNRIAELTRSGEKLDKK